MKGRYPLSSSLWWAEEEGEKVREHFFYVCLEEEKDNK